MTPYPQSLPVDGLIEVVREMISNRSFDLNDSKLARDIWEAVGYGLRLTLGEVSGVTPATGEIPFPETLPTEEILVVIAAIRAKKAPNADIAKAIWEVVGYALFKHFGVVIPAPAPVPQKDDVPGPQHGEVIMRSTPFGDVDLEDDEFFLGQLELALNHPRGPVAGFIPLPWGLIIKWGLSLLLKVI